MQLRHKKKHKKERLETTRLTRPRATIASWKWGGRSRLGGMAPKIFLKIQGF